MKKIQSYIVLDKLEETRKSEVYRVRKEGEETTYIIKILKSEIINPTTVARFRQEYDTIKKIDSPHVIKTYDYIDLENSFALVMEDFKGISLHKYLLKQELPLDDFINIGLQLTEALAHIHSHNIIHKDIKPENIIIDENKKKCKIIDFGISAELSGEKNIYNPEIIGGTLLFISPEQTGRMNRTVDYRSDFYSLGVTFYMMITGRAPFESSDPLEVIHAHIARKPTPPISMKQKIPRVISGIVMKLLEKNAEDRYQSSYGLLMDLKKCRESLSSKGYIEDFIPAQNDLSLLLSSKQKQFGREKEIGIIESIFKKTLAGGRNICFVRGEPGVGKSSFVNSIEGLILSNNGLFLSGKFDLMKKNIPYSAFIQAFNKIIKQMITENPASIDAWKKKFNAALGPNGKLITDIIPEIELIIGQQPEIKKLKAEDSQNRFHTAFTNFISTFPEKNRPLILFLDDLQWADSASFKVIKEIITNQDFKNICIILAYRHNKLEDMTSIEGMIGEITKIDPGLVYAIDLAPLSLEDTMEYVAHITNKPKEDLSGLVEILFKKTGGNPFFMNHFLEKLRNEKLLTIDPELGWSWRIDAIDKLVITDNVIELIVDKIQKLDEKSIEILHICACIGNWFDLKEISIVSGENLQQTLEIMNKLAGEDIVMFSESAFIFTHDKIHDAVYSIISSEKKKELHYAIGMNMLGRVKEEELNDKIFYIVNHLNNAKENISDPDLIQKLIKLNFIAGEKAKDSAAGDTALRYFQQGMSLMADNAWEVDYTFTLHYFEEASETAYIASEYEEMKRLNEAALRNAKTVYDKAKIYEIIIYSSAARNAVDEAVNAGIEYLKNFDVHIPKKVTKFHIIKNLMSLRLSLIGKEIADLYTLPELNNKKLWAVEQIIVSLAFAAYMSNTDLFIYLTIFTVKLSIKHGNSSLSPFGYAGYGLILCGALNDFDRGYAMGSLAVDLIQKQENWEHKCKTHMTQYSFINHWKKPLHESIDQLYETYKSGLESGDHLFACSAAHMHCNHKFFSGGYLPNVEKDLRYFGDVIQSFHQETFFIFNRIFLQTVLNLLEMHNNPEELTGEVFDEKKSLPVFIEKNNTMALASIYLYKIILAYLYEKFSSSRQYIVKLKKDSISLIGMYSYPIFFYFGALSISADDTGSKSNIAFFKKALKKMKRWAKHSPENFLHMYYLLHAEDLKLQKKYIQAMKYYEMAIQNARKNKFTMHLAVAYECAGRFYLHNGFNDLSRTYFNEALGAYTRWGASGKVQHMLNTYSQLLDDREFNSYNEKDDASLITGTTNSSLSISKSIDVSTVIKAAESFISETDLHALLANIMHFILENAGAQKGYLILKNKEGKLRIEARGDVDTGVSALLSIELDDCDDLSIGIVQYAYKTENVLVLQDAINDGIFKNDPYVKRNNSKSIIAVPIIHKGILSGIIYLENNLVTGAFKDENVQLINVLSTQAAISIENARLLIHRENEAKLEREMEIAATIQKRLLPSGPAILGYEIISYIKPAQMVGGDFYDIINCEGRDWIIIGDVAGHGVPAGLVMLMAQTAIHVTLQHNPHIKPSKLLTAINKTISKNIKQLEEEKYMTITVFSLENDGNFTFSGLHQDILIYRSATGKVEKISTSGFLLGLSDDFEKYLDDKTFNVECEDVILLYTDGITESWIKGSIVDQREPKYDMFSTKRLIDILERTGKGDCAAIKDAIMDALEGYDSNDDVTMVILKRKS